MLKRDNIRHILYVAVAVAFALLFKQFVDVMWPQIDFKESSKSQVILSSTPVDNTSTLPFYSHTHTSQVAYHHTRTASTRIATPTGMSMNAVPDLASQAPQSFASAGMSGGSTSVTYASGRKKQTRTSAGTTPIPSGSLYAVTIARPFSKSLPSEASTNNNDERPTGEVHTLDHDMGDFTGKTDGDNSGDVGDPIPLGDGWIMILFAACFAAWQFISRKKSKNI